MVVTRERLEGADLDSFFGPVRVEWDHAAAMTPLGQLPFFIDFLKTSGLFEAFVADCPLRYVSPNAPKTRDVLAPRCSRCSPAIGATRISRRCAATRFCRSFWG